MKAISVRQPWADAILHFGKRIENRTWNTRYRGPLLIHAARQPAEDEDVARDFIARASGQFGANCIPAAEHYGGIIARAVLVDVVRESSSPWFTGPYGFVLADVEPVPFFPCRGMPGLFEVEMRRRRRNPEERWRGRAVAPAAELVGSEVRPISCGRCEAPLGAVHIVSGPGQTSMSYRGLHPAAHVGGDDILPTPLCGSCAKALVRWLESGKLS